MPARAVSHSAWVQNASLLQRDLVEFNFWAHQSVGAVASSCLITGWLSSNVPQVAAGVQVPDDAGGHPYIRA
jgi:hypothetical protein